MNIRTLAVLTLGLFFCPTISHADSLPLGIASAYNLVALGGPNKEGVTVAGSGNLSASSDVGGRIAAAGQINTGSTMTVGSKLNNDPYGSNAAFLIDVDNGISSGTAFNILSTGNAYAPGANASAFHFKPGGQLDSAGISGIDFGSLRTSLDAESIFLAGLSGTGTNLGTNQPGVNPSFFVLKGTSATLNVFNITAAEFADANHQLDIVAPAGSTIIINVDGKNLTLGAPILFNGQQYSGDNEGTQDILFNFADADSVNLSASFSASVLAPFALLTGSNQISGTFIAAQIAVTGGVHNIEFTGAVPHPGNSGVVPEPSTLALMGAGMLSIAAGLRGRMKR